jgi:hypothetical protein
MARSLLRLRSREADFAKHYSYSGEVEKERLCKLIV